MEIAFISLSNKSTIVQEQNILYAFLQDLSCVHHIKCFGREFIQDIEQLHKFYKGGRIPFIPTDYAEKIGEIFDYLLQQSHFHLLLTEDPWIATTLHIRIPILVLSCEATKGNIAISELNGKIVTSACIKSPTLRMQIIKDIEDYVFNNVRQEQEENPIPVFAVNLKHRLDRRHHIIQQFAGRSEFYFVMLNAIEDVSARLGLWKSLRLSVCLAKARNFDYFIFCEDDHIFTEHYSRDYLCENIIGADLQKADLLCGGIGGTDLAVPVSCNRFFIGHFNCTQFVIIYKRFYDAVLNYNFVDGDTADGVLSVIAHSKMTIYPFLSRQRSFGYSDVTPQNNEYDIENYFESADKQLSLLQKISHHYNYPWIR